jgi:hypothetical protein
MRRTAVLAAAVVLSAIAPAHAAHLPGCEESWPTKKRCEFAIRGMPIDYYATILDGGSVTIQIERNAPAGPIVIASRTCTGGSYVLCNGRFGPLDALGLPPIDPYAQSIPLTCRVLDTAGRGEFGCFSYS